MRYAITTLIILAIFISAYRGVPVYTKAELIGAINPGEHDDFILVSPRWTNKRTFLRKETYDAFVAMATAAQKDGIQLQIVSGTRNRDRQAEIWEEKWERFTGSNLEKANEIMQFSSMPGTSRHHWGTDFDINSVEVAYFETEYGKKVYNWMQQNAWNYGFFQPYNKLGTNRYSGYKDEKWHWSYYPLSYRFLKAYNKLVKQKDIKGFNGADLAKELHVFDQYVNGIDSPHRSKTFPPIIEDELN